MLIKDKGLHFTALFSLLIILISPAHAQLNILETAATCASDATKRMVQAYYAEHPGEPLHVPSQILGVPEVQIATALASAKRVSVRATEDQLKDIWTSIDNWGTKTEVRVVFTLGGHHRAVFPSLIPMRQEDLDDGWLDIYADDGKGVHGHLQLAPVTSVHAIQLPGPAGETTQLIGLYQADGTLAIGVYTSTVGHKADPAAVKGFAATRELLKTLPKLCG